MKQKYNKELMEKDSKIIKDKESLNKVYTRFYIYMKHSLPKVPGKIVELGSGGGFIKKIIPETITSDLVKGKNIDIIVDAEKLPFKNSSIGAFLLLDTFHHIPNSESAIIEMERCLVDGGRIIMVEPFNSFWGKFIYKNFHYERFDDKSGWKLIGKDPKHANNALPWIIFVRDRVKFEKKFPNLKIVSVKPHTPFTFLITGGTTHPQIVPFFLYSYVSMLELLLSPLNTYVGMFATYVIEKKK